MISVDAALDHILALVAPLDPETVPLSKAAGRVLARPAQAEADQPPFDASAMDGYAVTAGDATLGARLRLEGESAAGHGFDGTLAPGQTVRILTGAPVPAGAARVVIQEDVTRTGDMIEITTDPGTGRNIRPAGNDFAAGSTLDAPRRLGPADLALLAAMNVPAPAVFRRPDVALITTGDELVIPGGDLGPGQIRASNAFGIKAIAESEGAIARLLPIARDTAQSLDAVFDLAEGADMVVTIGGASVGDHDLVAPVARARGLDTRFYKVAMRPGKPLMAGRLGDAVLLGLPGNPVSALICAHLFLRPALRAFQGLAGALPQPRQAPLAGPLGANGPRAHYMRARLDQGRLHPFESQDSSLLHTLSQASALIVRAPHAPPAEPGDLVDYLPFGRDS